MFGRIHTRRLQFQVALFLLLTELMIGLQGVRRTHRGLSRLADALPIKQASAPTTTLAQRIADEVDGVALKLPLFPSQCLSRSLVLHYFLRRYGLLPTLCLGVQTVTGHFRAHAWIEHDGRELNEKHPASRLYHALSPDQLRAALERSH